MSFEELITMTYYHPKLHMGYDTPDEAITTLVDSLRTWAIDTGIELTDMISDLPLSSSAFDRSAFFLVSAEGITPFNAEGLIDNLEDQDEGVELCRAWPIPVVNGNHITLNTLLTTMGRVGLEFTNMERTEQSIALALRDQVPVAWESVAVYMQANGLIEGVFDTEADFQAALRRGGIWNMVPDQAPTEALTVIGLPPDTEHDPNGRFSLDDVGYDDRCLVQFVPNSGNVTGPSIDAYMPMGTGNFVYLCVPEDGSGLFVRPGCKELQTWTEFVTNIDTDDYFLPFYSSHGPAYVQSVRERTPVLFTVLREHILRLRTLADVQEVAHAE